MYRDLLEYGLSFFDHKTVAKIKADRENKKEASEELSDKDKKDSFVESFKKKDYTKFGKLSEISPESKTNNKKNNVDNKIKHISKLSGD